MAASFPPPVRGSRRRKTFGGREELKKELDKIARARTPLATVGEDPLFGADGDDDEADLESSSVRGTTTTRSSEDVKIPLPSTTSPSTRPGGTWLSGTALRGNNFSGVEQEEPPGVLIPHTPTTPSVTEDSTTRSTSAALSSVADDAGVAAPAPFSLGGFSSSFFFGRSVSDSDAGAKKTPESPRDENISRRDGKHSSDSLPFSCNTASSVGVDDLSLDDAGVGQAACSDDFRSSSNSVVPEEAAKILSPARPHLSAREDDASSKVLAPGSSTLLAPPDVPQYSSELLRQQSAAVPHHSAPFAPPPRSVPPTGSFLEQGSFLQAASPALQHQPTAGGFLAGALQQPLLQQQSRGIPTEEQFAVQQRPFSPSHLYPRRAAESDRKYSVCEEEEHQEEKESFLPSFIVPCIQKTSAAAADGLGAFGDYFHDCVEQGSDGVRALGFVGGAAMVCSFFAIF